LVVPANHQHAATRSTNYTPDTAHIVQLPEATRTVVNDTIGTTHLVQHPHHQQQQQPPLQLQLVQILPNGQHVYMRVGDVPAVLPPPPPLPQLQTLYIPPHDHMVPSHVGNSNSSHNKSAFSSLPNHSPHSVSNGNGQLHANRANFDQDGTYSPASDHSDPSGRTAASRSLRKNGTQRQHRLVAETVEIVVTNHRETPFGTSFDRLSPIRIAIGPSSTFKGTWRTFAVIKMVRGSFSSDSKQAIR
jgi:hypothetical protein